MILNNEIEIVELPCSDLSRGQSAMAKCTVASWPWRVDCSKLGMASCSFLKGDVMNIFR